MASSLPYDSIAFQFLGDNDSLGVGPTVNLKMPQDLVPLRCSSYLYHNISLFFFGIESKFSFAAGAYASVQAGSRMREY